MSKPLVLFMVLFQLLSSNVVAQTTVHIEIFDISKGKVVMDDQVTNELQQDVQEFLNGITGVFTQLKPIPEKGFMVKIPIDPTMVQNKWFNDVVDEVILIFPDYENPYLLVFDDENNPRIFTFTGDTNMFMAKLIISPIDLSN
ncbi:hypothetical protein [Fredinandcohnia sp. 179-A 10B2 NHS]|uniref:hypothetical protein n=1 Tax=Fredinandcohnia sp. 179-A 10B2 NHS TaxID=3235176 RepID=UPI0039A22866